MKIVIAGAGEMGSHLAKMLSGNGHDITIIDAESWSWLFPAAIPRSGGMD